MYTAEDPGDKLSQDFLDGEEANYRGDAFREEASNDWKEGWKAAQRVREAWEALTLRGY